MGFSRNIWCLLVVVDKLRKIDTLLCVRNPYDASCMMYLLRMLNLTEYIKRNSKINYNYRTTKYTLTQPIYYGDAM